MLNIDFKEFVELLNSRRVEYLIVGGYALAAHGHPRYTGDIDIWFGPGEANIRLLLDALQAFGFGGLGISAEDLSREQAVVQLGYPPARIDLLSTIDGVHFRECYASRFILNVGGIELPVISKDAFRANKLAVGRLKDLADLEALDKREDPE